ncbi:Phospholipid-transporting ATPase IA [Echinococcus granulosus]|nr:Phospholipid-transporting ATPase IA [Echinococcus granulosus]
MMVRAEDQTDYKTLHSAASTPPLEQERVIFINEFNETKFCNNSISTGKYSLLTFVPKFLFEQFRKYANIFFLLVALFQQIPGVSPTGRFTTVVPLSFILCVSAVKEIIEDYARHSADKATNNSETYVLRNGSWERTLWKDVQVGDFVKLTSNCPIPADLVIIATSEPMSICYIETSNLDGETALKLRQGIPPTSGLLTAEALRKARLRIECEQPTRCLEEFVGTLYDENNTGYPLDSNQMLLRGATVKNTNWVFGAVVYTGKETKVMLNSTAAPLKRSSVDKQTNYYILVLFGLLTFLTIFMVIANVIWTKTVGKNMWYLTGVELSVKSAGFMCITAFIIFHTIIPISLQVTLEVVRFVQALFINWDLDMYDAKTDTPAMARTSNLNEDLGQVKYMFSDKTGTLTKNVMEFKMCSIGRDAYGLEDQEASALQDWRLRMKLLERDRDVDWFFTILAVCHTVIPEYVDIDIDRDDVRYQATSPDERALVMAAKAVGYVFCEREPDSVTIRVKGEDIQFKLLHVIEFTSERKRMSVIVEDADGKIFLMVKGADTVIYERLASDALYREETLSHMDEFASLGLRTLCIAFRRLDRAFYEEWALSYYKASISVTNRNALLDEVCELIEQDLQLVGATAIEDKLQDEVPQTIANILAAGISIWVLTGDKQETAVNIGISCRLVNPEQVQLIINGSNLDAVRDQLFECGNELAKELAEGHEVALIVTGKALELLLTAQCHKEFFEIAHKSSSVICCRVSPWQKAEVVRLARTFTNDITLAIGDGANDVGMIQAAHIGVGIYGVEGRQAACSSDYAIAQFRFLNKLLLVHGAWSFNRITKVILYSFYKNICLYVIQFWFGMVSGFSGQIIFDRWSMALYNVAFSAAPPLALGLFERNMSAKNCLKLPMLYKETQRTTTFDKVTFLTWLANGVFHSAILFWIPLFAFYSDVAYPNGHTGSRLVVGSTVYTCVVMTVCLKAGLEHTAWTVFSHLAIWGTIVLWFLFLIVYSHVYPTFPIGPEMVGMDMACFSSPLFWLLLIVVPVIALTRDFAWKVLRRTYSVTMREQVMLCEQNGVEPEPFMQMFKPHRTRGLRLFRHQPFVPIASDAPSLLSQPPDHGYAFSQVERGRLTQTDIVRACHSTETKPTGI